MGPVSTWYRTSVSGIEQGFTIGERPAGAGSSVAIELRSSGTLTPVATSGGALSLRSADGRSVLTYGALSVTDAIGHAVPSHLQVTKNQVRIVVDDRNAVYPLTVDPLTQQAELTATSPNAGAANDDFGSSVALSADGTVALVGVPFRSVGGHTHQGAAYVFSGTNFSTVTYLTAPTSGADAGAVGDQFGWSVALSADGSVALVGADNRTVGGRTSEGAAYIFSGANWSTVTYLTEPTSGPGAGLVSDAFGTSVALSGSGTNAIIGAPTGQRVGKVFVFDGAGWGTEAALLTPSDGANYDSFGHSVALSTDGSTAIIGAPDHTVGSNSSQGAAYVFGGTNWATQEAELTSSNGASGDEFGASVALSSTGAIALVGANYVTVGTATDAGAAYVLSGPNWSQQTELVASNGTNYAAAGAAVALSPSGLTAVVAAPGAEVGSAPFEGAVYTFGGNDWSTQTEGTSADGAGNDSFGTAVAISSNGATTIIGAPNHTVGGNSGQGAAYILAGAAEPLAPTPGIPTVSGGSVTFPWSAVSGATSYTLTVYVNGVAQTPITGLTGLSYTLAHAIAGDAYSFTVATVVGGVTTSASAMSSSVTVPTPAPTPAPTASASGYWTVAGDGGVFSFGPSFYGSTGDLKLNQPVFAMASTSDGDGYWFVAKDGGIFSYGDAAYHGSVPGLGVAVTNIVGMAADPATGGYWVVGSDGGVYAFGAPFDGSVPGVGVHVNDIVGIAATPDGGGYYLVSSTGAVYAFGDAKYQGGANTLSGLNAPIVGISVDSATGGYWEAGAKGGVYAYGAPFDGSAGATTLAAPIVGIAATTSGSGYYLGAADGGVFAYDAPYVGSMGGKHLNAPMVGIAVAG